MQSPSFPVLDHLAAAEDARTIVPGVDRHGGVVIYRQGRLTHYGMNGEWFEAVPVPDPLGVLPSDDKVPVDSGIDGADEARDLGAGIDDHDSKAEEGRPQLDAPAG